MYSWFAHCSPPTPIDHLAKIATVAVASAAIQATENRSMRPAPRRQMTLFNCKAPHLAIRASTYENPYDATGEVMGTK